MNGLEKRVRRIFQIKDDSITFESAINRVSGTEEVKMRVHELKIYSDYFNDIIEGRKRFELRKDDRDFRVGDILVLNEVNDELLFTGEQTIVLVTYILRDVEPYGLKEGYCIMGITTDLGGIRRSDYYES